MKNNILFLLLFYCISSYSQGFRGAELNYSLRDDGKHDIILNLYYNINEEIGPDSVHINPGTGLPVDTVGLTEIIEINDEISLYRYVTNWYIGDDTHYAPFWVEPFSTDYDNITDDCILRLRATLNTDNWASSWFNPYVAHWNPYLFDHHIDENGALIMNIEGYDEGAETGYFFSEYLYYFPSGCLIEDNIDSLLLDINTGDIIWPEPRVGKFLFGFDLVELDEGSNLILNRFPRYLIIELTEEDFITTTRDELDNNNQNISIYPNPTQDILNIEYGGLIGPLQLQVTNMQGQLMHEEILESFTQLQSQKIDVRQWPTGIYVIELSSAQGRVVKKVLVGK